MILTLLGTIYGENGGFYSKFHSFKRFSFKKKPEFVVYPEKVKKQPSQVSPKANSLYSNLSV